MPGSAKERVERFLVQNRLFEIEIGCFHDLEVTRDYAAREGTRFN